MAYDQLLYSVPPHGPLLHRRPQRVRLLQCPVRLFPLLPSPSLSPFHSDISWGTKGDNKVNTDLGVVKTTGGKGNQVEVIVPTEERDINAAYEDAIHVLSTKPPVEEKKVDVATQQEDYYRQFRTK